MRPSWAIALALGLVLTFAACTRVPTERTPVQTVPEGTGTKISVPDVTQLTTTEANRILTRVGLTIRVKTAGGDDAIVLSQSPPPGTSVDTGSTVTLVARCYPAPCPVPPEGETIYDPCTCASH